MKLLKKRGQRHEDNMLAMIDVVFLLLIYFLCTAQFGILELDFNADLSTGMSQEQADSEQDFETVKIFILADDAGFLCNRMSYSDIHSLRVRLEELRSLYDARIIIDAQEGVIFQSVMAVMDETTALDFSNVSFAGKQ